MRVTSTCTLVSRLCALLVVGALGAVALPPASADGPAAIGNATATDTPIDGVWLVEGMGTGIGPAYYASIHQNGATVVAILLSATGEWIYVVGTRTGATVDGTAYQLTGQVVGPWDATLTSPATMTGVSVVNSATGATRPFTASRIF